MQSRLIGGQTGTWVPMPGPKVFATWVSDDEENRAELTRILLDFDTSEADVREADGEHFVVLTFPDDTDEERALAQASEIVRGAADSAGVPAESIELSAGADSD